jgi:hypothetical protein
MTNKIQPIIQRFKDANLRLLGEDQSHEAVNSMNQSKSPDIDPEVRGAKKTFAL